MMATPEANDSGAEFEENPKPQKVEVTRRERAEKPAVDGAEAARELETETLEKPAGKTTLQPDISAEQVKPEVDNDTAPKSDKGQLVNEMAQAADKKSAKNAEPDSSIDQKVQALVDNKTYFVPIGQVSKRRNTRIFVVVLLLVVVAAVAAYLMVL